MECVSVCVVHQNTKFRIQVRRETAVVDMFNEGSDQELSEESYQKGGGIPLGGK
jgi:hypothetical protein